MQSRKRGSRTNDKPAADDRPPRERILNAAFGAFVELGYANTSTIEIATRAKVSKRDLYANFANKRAILAHAIEGRARRMRLPLELPLPKDKAALSETLVRFGAVTLREGTLPTTVAVFRLAIGESDPEVANVLQSVALAANRAALVEFLVQAQERKLLVPGDALGMAEQFIALLWGNTLMALLLRVGVPPDEREAERRAAETARVFLLLYGRG